MHLARYAEQVTVLIRSESLIRVDVELPDPGNCRGS